MYLSEILTRLCEGEFADLSLGYMVDASPQSEHYGKLVRHVDMGLLELHKRFPLKVSQVYIQQYAHIGSYVLHSKYAETNTESTETYKYIKDTIYNQFDDSAFLCIDKLFDELGNEVPLNNQHEVTSLYTTGFNTIQVPYPNPNNTFMVQYRAAHGNLDSTKGSLEVEVAFPYSHLEALLYYIVSRVLSSTQIDASNNYLLKFEQSCNKLRELNLNNYDETPGEQFRLGGWV